MDQDKNGSLGTPLIFHPKKQLSQRRAKNQQPVYIAQMDLRVDLSEVWNHLQLSNPAQNIFIKLILPEGTNQECFHYLNGMGVTRDFMFPD
jgi:hypothetical protein